MASSTPNKHKVTIILTGEDDTTRFDSQRYNYHVNATLFIIIFFIFHCINQGWLANKEFMEASDMVAITSRVVQAGLTSVPLLEPTALAPCLMEKVHILLSLIISIISSLTLGLRFVSSKPSLGCLADNVIIPIDLTQLFCPGFTLAAGSPSGCTTDIVGCWGEALWRAFNLTAFTPCLTGPVDYPFASCHE
jgi:hypothetical protein